MVQVVRTWENWAHQVPITVGVTGYKFYIEYGMAMPQRNPGDVILVTANAEVTNPLPFNVQIDSYIGYGPADANQDMTISFTPVSGTDVPPEIHHQLVRLTGVIDDALLIKKGLPLTLPENWLLTLMMEAATTDPRGSGKWLVNEGPGYGELVAVIFPASGDTGPVSSHTGKFLGTISGTVSGTIS